MRYTDIVKARALRRAGRACEMCGTPVSFDSARFVSAHPIFGILFDQDDCCVLCGDCLADLDPETRAAAERGPPAGFEAHELCEEPAAAEGSSASAATASDPTSADSKEPSEQRATPEQQPEAAGLPKLPRTAREAWFPERGPGGGMCA